MGVTTLRRILLTGGTGFLGSHLLTALRANNYEVLATTRGNIPSSPNRIVEKGTQWLSSKDAARTIEKYKPFAIIHLATDYGTLSPLHETLISNEAWPLQLLEAGIRAGTQIFLNTDTFFAKSNFTYPHMRPYTLSKSGFLSWGRYAVTGTSTRFITLRLEHVYGENDNQDKFVPMLLRKLNAGLDIETTEGTQRRDFIHAADVVNAYITVLEQYTLLLPAVDEIEVGSGQSVTLRSFMELAKALSRSSSKLRFGSIPMRPHEIMESSADISILTKLGWMPQLSLEAGLLRCLS